ncbi:hypothetical protein SEA_LORDFARQUAAD_57 [Gordonia phage LordFarquaad]|uniref:Uncharacterized protein n=3 Tax=Attisvirus attis TaxID=2169707 RepID=A0A142K8U7_9CAUD|nr:hypothetical protein SEA_SOILASSASSIN_55 [Gordonia phage SoilAssassin]YP_009595813.1 hypothetical protein FDH00_gp55 [Gordonia phage Attis]AMS02456.1 hypothetical protein SEA_SOILASSASSIN_55 [Gordonia phage SoilAssassin]AMS02530.1 hypothetical protein SEA_ATTIS_55 [Gordonia phage Attis]QDF18377.1 hypothetical protein SEA_LORDFARQUAAD_57 [Gordonia phage LordFarquaad]
MTQPKRYCKKPVEIEALQMPDGYPADGSPTSVGYAQNIRAHVIYQWIEANTLGSFDVNRLWLDPENFSWPESGVSIDARDGRMVIATLEGGHWVSPGDFVIRGVQGEFYPCKPDIFAATYDEVSDV